MKNLAKALLMALIITTGISGVIGDAYAGQATATAMVVIIIPDQKAQSQTMLAQENSSSDESETSKTESAQRLAYKK